MNPEPDDESLNFENDIINISHKDLSQMLQDAYHDGFIACESAVVQTTAKLIVFKKQNADLKTFGAKETAKKLILKYKNISSKTKHNYQNYENYLF